MMQDNKTQLFGVKDKFAIELKAHNTPNKFFLRLWFNGNSIGALKKEGTLNYLIKSYFKFLKEKNTLYEDSFINMSDMEIYKDVVLKLFTILPPEVELLMYNRMKKYAFDFGDYQFTNFSFLILNIEKEKKIKFLIYEMDGKSDPKLHAYLINIFFFISIFKEFLRYAYEKKLNGSKSFFPEGFSFEDIL